VKKLAIIGGGAAGMMASIFAAKNGMEVHVYEKNEKLGKKLYITGKGRCNLTNNCSREEFFAGIKSNPKFLYSAFRTFDNQDTIDFFEQEGLPLKTERGLRVFPVSDKSADVLDTLRRAMKKAGVHVHLNMEVSSLQKDGTRFVIEWKDHQTTTADFVFIATGGLSYPSTGSTGAGYQFAEKLGIEVTDTCPSLVPFNIREEIVKKLQGLSLKNVSIKILDGKKLLFEEQGEMLFTHFGVSGPLVLSASSVCAARLKEKELKLVLDLKPALSMEQLDARVLREFETSKNRQFKNVVPVFFPAKLVAVMIDLSGIAPDKKIHEITKEERLYFIHCIKELELTITGLRSYGEAVITKGGVSVKEICPKTMESKKVPGLYFIGEVLDLDAITGGFNLQIAWSTAVAAATAVTKRDNS